MELFFSSVYACSEHTFLLTILLCLAVNTVHILFSSVVLYCGRVPAANAPGCTAAEGLLYKP